ncbi:UDP-N-acetylmuramate dehydrogenase, partial [bacterium]|nr:UDP-N-acetylmuramate dehydrogenase [candidate division CSSED10-310 bacterium]
MTDWVAGVRLADLTTMGVGGAAEVLWRPDSLDDLRSGLPALRSAALPVTILGGGSNLLVRDGGVSGVVLKLGRGFGEVVVRDTEVTCGAAVGMHALVGMTRRLGTSGLEWATGLPGTVGGALIGNAGAAGMTMLDRVISIDLVDWAGQVHHIDRDALTAGYRSCGLPVTGVVVSVTLRLVSSLPDAVAAECRRIFGRRRATQPLGEASAGCIFRNPAGQSAGALIDRVRLKGVSIGGARISPRHANFIVNQGGASCADVLALMTLIQRRVWRTAAVALEPEVKVIGSA